MYKNFSAEALGVSARQSEKIELALTYGFDGIEVDILDMLKRAEGGGIDHARRYIESANIRVGGFQLPLDLSGDDAAFKTALAEVEKAAELAKAIEAGGCWTAVLPASDTLPYHENFELHRKRLSETADLLAKYDLRLGLSFLAAASHRADHEFQFIHQAEALLTLIKSVAASNVGLALDCWNWHVGGGTIEQFQSLAPEQIVAVYLSDLPADADTETIEEEQCMLPGAGGAIDSAAVLAALKDLGYEGPVAVRAHSSQRTTRIRDVIVQQAAKTLNELWTAVEPSESELSSAGAEN